MKIGAKIQNYRKQAGLSQEDLAYKIGVSRQTISKWERDDCMPEIEKIVTLSKLFDVSVDELLENETKNTQQIGTVESAAPSIDIDKKVKTGKTILIVGLISIMVSVLLTEVWALMDSIRGGGWYANKLVYLIASPLAIIFFSSIATAIVGTIIIIKWNYKK